MAGHFAERHFAERHFAERHFAERHFAERTFCRRTLCRTNILSNGQFDERTFRRHFAENREILGVVTRTAYDWLLNKTSQSYNQFINVMTETLIVKSSFVLYSFTFLTNLPTFCDIKNPIIKKGKLFMYMIYIFYKMQACHCSTNYEQ